MSELLAVGWSHIRRWKVTSPTGTASIVGSHVRLKKSHEEQATPMAQFMLSIHGNSEHDDEWGTVAVGRKRKHIKFLMTQRQWLPFSFNAPMSEQQCKSTRGRGMPVFLPLSHARMHFRESQRAQGQSSGRREGEREGEREGGSLRSQNTASLPWYPHVKCKQQYIISIQHISTKHCAQWKKIHIKNVSNTK